MRKKVQCVENRFVCIEKSVEDIEILLNNSRNDL